MIDSLAADVLNVDLAHITGRGIVEGDKIAIRNLLEIFAGLLEYFMEYVDDEGRKPTPSGLFQCYTVAKLLNMLHGWVSCECREKGTHNH